MATHTVERKKAVPAASLHIIPHPDGGWSLKRGGAERSTRKFGTKAAAVKYGRIQSKKNGSDLYIHKRSGAIESKVPSTAGRKRIVGY